MLNYVMSKLTRNKQIFENYLKGDKISEISKYFGLSESYIKQILSKEKKKEALFNKMRNNGIFWSYDKNVPYTKFNDNIIIEHTLKYGDFEDIVKLTRLYGTKIVKSVWRDKMKNDERFKKVNVLIARVILNMKIDNIESKNYERLDKIKQFAS
ncbi:hypothetical protein DSN97_08990 [Deferribacteraceae bacterium V6Fe1]|nr:hypothetical protein DSN97_08990 [Deferribacteraceae bacterium V6Fe1]